ncbi:MAG: hypothetical protein EA406_07255 [Rhodospirillales bacterium]|nr:MAG: hypothetical protein EA406_07255 [Rhodospirillales bacterium]
MWQQHPDIPFPADETAAIWRFMSVAGLVDLLDSAALAFSRLDSLDDPFEGQATAMDYVKSVLPEQVFRAAGGAPPEIRNKLDQWRVQQAHEMEQKQAIALLKRMPLAETCWVSCWHQVEEERAGLWRLYHPAGKPVAVCSTVGALRDALRDDAGHTVSIGQVQYAEGAQAAWSPIAQAMVKHRAFGEEREIRAIIAPAAGSANGLGPVVRVPVTLGTLVQAVRFSPVAEPWQVELGRRLLARFGLVADCGQSALHAHPAFMPSVA